MTEMKLLEDMFADVPAPGEARLAAVRARVLGEANRAAQPASHPDRGPGGTRVVTWPRLAWTAATVVALVIALIVAGVIPFRGTAAPASAADLLHRAAAAALTQPSPSDRQLIYTDTAIYYATSLGHGHVVRQQEWQSPTSPNGIYRTSPCEVDGNPQRSHGACSYQGGYAPGATAYSTYAGLRTLPTSTGALLAYLAGLPSGGQDSADREWLGANLIAGLNPVLPPRFAAALFRAVARIPGTALLPTATDAAGAHGIGIARTAAGIRAELIFGPGTYRLTGQQYTVLRQAHGRPGGYVESATALLHTGFVGTGSGPGAGPGRLSAPRDGQFIYTNTATLSRLPAPSRAGAAPRLTLQRGSEQMWQSVDGGKPGAFGTSPCQAGRGECLVLIPPGPQTPALTTYAGLAALPRPPTALLSYLQRHNTCPALARPGGRPARASTGSDEWEMLTALLGNNLVLPPGLGKALFEAAARIPGSAVLPAVADAAGGGGIAVARNDTPSLRTELIFAPRSYRFIGVQDVITRRDGGLRPGAVWAAASLRAARVVNTAPVTSLSQSYQAGTCGFIPGFYTTGSSGFGSSGGSGSSAPGADSGTGYSSSGSSGSSAG